MDFSIDTVEGGAWISFIVFILSAAAVWIGSVLVLNRTPKGVQAGGEDGGEAGGERNANRGRDIERRRRDPQLIGGFVARPAFLHAFQSAVKQLQAVFPSRYTRSFAANALDAMRSRVISDDRLLLISGGRLCGMLARRLLCFNGECAVRDALRLGTSALSRRHFFRNSSALRRRFWRPAAATTL
jgi:hypothetical protein